jgi:hypothetical protein
LILLPWPHLPHFSSLRCLNLFLSFCFLFLTFYIQLLNSLLVVKWWLNYKLVF